VLGSRMPMALTAAIYSITTSPGIHATSLSISGLSAELPALDSATEAGLLVAPIDHALITVLPGRGGRPSPKPTAMRTAEQFEEVTSR
jgi:hypothetical protein